MGDPPDLLLEPREPVEEAGERAFVEHPQADVEPGDHRRHPRAGVAGSPLERRDLAEEGAARRVATSRSSTRTSTAPSSITKKSRVVSQRAITCSPAAARRSDESDVSMLASAGSSRAKTETDSPISACRS